MVPVERYVVQRREIDGTFTDLAELKTHREASYILLRSARAIDLRIVRRTYIVSDEVVRAYL